MIASNYLRLCAIISVLLVLCFDVAMGSDSIHKIDGEPHEAVETKVRNILYVPFIRIVHYRFLFFLQYARMTSFLYFPFGFKKKKTNVRRELGICKRKWKYNKCCGGCGKKFFKKSQLIRAVNDYVVDKHYGKKTYGRMNCWDVSDLTNLEELFYSYHTFNSNINCWDVRKVTKMNSMFQEATNFNKPLDKWYPKSVENLTFMFSGAAAFNQNLCSWHYKLPPNTNALDVFGFSACGLWILVN